MAAGPQRGRAARDEGVAGVVGVALVLAVVVAGLHHAAREEIPRREADALREWDANVGTVVSRLARAAGANAATPAGVFPVPNSVDGVSIPFLGALPAETPSGALAFEPACAAVDVEHRPHGGAVVKDLVRGARGCLVARSGVGVPFTHRLEAGAHLRVEGTGAVLMAGPVFDVAVIDANAYRVSIVLPTLEGQAAGVALPGARVTLTPVGATSDHPTGRNAGQVNLTFETAHPLAWKTWFDESLRRSGLVASRASPPAGASAADFAVTCSPCTSTPTTPGKVLVTLYGPRTDANDLQFAVTLLRFAVRIA